MTFAAPLFLAAALAAIVPIILHLIHRRRAREVAFPTLRFLKISVQRTRRRRYLDDALLMLIRVAVLVLVAIGLAQPALTGLSGLLGRGGGRAVAIVLDNSGSMAWTDDGRPRVETAREAATRIVDGLAEGDAVGLFPTGGPPSPSLGRFHRDQALARQFLAVVRASGERADLTATVQRARQALEKANASQRELYVLSDNQAVSWSSLGEPAKTDARGDRSMIPVVVVNLDHAPGLNVAIRDVRLDVPAPVAGVTARVTAEVVNLSTMAQQRHIELHVDGSRIETSPTLALPVGQSARHEFRFRLGDPGVHTGFVQLVEEDASPLDNRRDFALVADQRVSVGLVKARRIDVPLAEPSFYLERALASEGAESALRVTTFTPAELATAPLSGLSVVFLAGVPAPEPAVADRLVEYARAGGHVVWVAGPAVDPAAFNAADARAGHALLPAPLGTRRTPAAGSGGSFHVASLDATHPALAPLTEPSTLYQSVLVYHYLSLIDPPPSGIRVLARLDDDQPWIVSRSIGAGSVFWIGTELSVDGTNLPLRPIFLPLLARLCFHLAGAEAERGMLTAGAPIVVPLPPGGGAVRSVEVVRPSGERTRVEVTDARVTSFRHDETFEPGVYQVRLPDADPARVRAFAVHVDPRELDPTPLARAEVERRLAPGPVVWCATPAELTDATHRLREGVSLRNSFLIAVLIALVAESFLANRRGPALAEMPSGGPSPGAPASAPVAPATEDIGEILARV